MALALLGNRAEAEDTMQDAYLKLWNMRDRLPEYDNVEALAVTMTKNLCLDKLRSYRSRMQNSTEVERLPVRTERPEPDRETELRESHRVIRKIVETLPEQQKLIFHLRDVEQYSYDEIHEITGLTKNNIRVNLSRARKAVRTEYLKQQNYENQKN